MSSELTCQWYERVSIFRHLVQPPSRDTIGLVRKTLAHGLSGHAHSGQNERLMHAAGGALRR